MIFMFITSFIIQYFIMGLIMSNSYVNIRNSVGKFYISIIMSLFMVLADIIMHDMRHNSIRIQRYFVVTILLGLFIFLYRYQYGIDDIQYLNEMIEHHSMAILTSEDILEKTHDYNVRRLASQIVQTQSAEIERMKEMVGDNNKN